MYPASHSDYWQLLLARFGTMPGLFCRLSKGCVVRSVAVVTTVGVAAPAALLVMLRELVELKLKVGGAKAPLGLVERAAVRATLPVKPPVGVTVIVEVLPVVAPGAMLTAVPLTVKLGDVEDGW
jgi:hypothetical protein